VRPLIGIFGGGLPRIRRLRAVGYQRPLVMAGRARRVRLVLVERTVERGVPLLAAAGCGARSVLGMQFELHEEWRIEPRLQGVVGVFVEAAATA
jgi:hypothetical protein